MRNADVAATFEDLANRLEIQGANSFRVRAYRQAAKTIHDWPSELSTLLEREGQLGKIPGVGSDLAEKVVTLLQTGSLPQLEELRQEIPDGVVELLRIPGLGPKKIAVLFQELKVQNAADLQQAVETGQVAALKGFGEKTAQTILTGLGHLAESGRRVYLSEALPQVESIVEVLRRVPGVKQVVAAGSVRRRKETINDLDVLATAAESAPAMTALAQHPLVKEVLAGGPTKQRVRLHSGVELDLRVVPEDSFGAAWQYFTGSKEHNIEVRKRGVERGLKINEYGVFRGEELVAGRTEEDVYAAVGLAWVPPELRENRGEIERAEQGTLPTLLELRDMRGDLHMHTTATDGTATIREMAAAAVARGLEYIAITDHSQRVQIANGLTPERLRAHWRDIENVRHEFPQLQILRGIECDILEDGRMDLPDDVLSEADWVIAVLHFGLKQPAEQIEMRLLNAIRNPHVHVIGHPTARIVGQRPPVDCRMELIFEAAAQHNVLLEMNADPARLDLHDIHAASAKALGIPIVISTDAHSTAGFDSMRYGVFQARRAGLSAVDVANTRTWQEFQAFLTRRQ